MNYCLFSDDSDVYVYEDCNHGFCCGACCFLLGRSAYFMKRSLLIDHLERHLNHGHNVPQHVFDELKTEIITKGDDWKSSLGTKTTTNERKTMLEKGTLLEVGDSYVQANWNHPQAPSGIFAIYRLNKRGNNWEMHQPARGPWSRMVNGKVVNEREKFSEAYKESAIAATAIFEDLRRIGIAAVKDEWDKAGGVVLDM